MTKNYLIGKYHVAVYERDALNEGTLTAEETAGYWLYEAGYNPKRELMNMLGINRSSEADEFYSEVLSLLDEAAND